MREIKFRAWIARDGVMFSDSGLLADFFTWLDQWKESKGPYVLMQYTGLKDKSGLEIYEGDILSSPHFTTVAGMTYTLNHLVEWSDKLHGWFLLSCQSKNPNDGSIQLFVAKNSEMSVIGNLHENPELIK